MAVQTPITGSNFISSIADQRVAIAKFASVGNNDTYLAPLGVITAITAESGNTATTGVTWTNGANGSTVTFAIGSGPATNVTFMAFGY